MTRVTILGAGDMGTALATPAARSGCEVRLWGTERDSAIVAALRAGEPHPRLGTLLPAGVRVFAAAESGAALAGAEIAIVAITSSAVHAVVSALAPLLASVGTIVTVAKGFHEDERFGIQILPSVISRLAVAEVVAVGGPSKANEVALGRPTAVIYAGSLSAVANCREALSTPVYRIAASTDVVGVEIAAAMKNAYAVALGVADGLRLATGEPHHNLRAALFPIAVREMERLAIACGGKPGTALGAAGAGDLQVTITAGRNRQLGERIGAGQAVHDAVAELAAHDTTIEGYAATSFGHRLRQRAISDGHVPTDGFPLLDALHAILYHGAEPLPALWSAVEEAGREDDPSSNHYDGPAIERRGESGV